MPGLVVFHRRWSVGSDDLVVPGAFLLSLHIICFIIVLVSSLVFQYDTTILSIKLLLYLQIGYLLILFSSICVESAICVISMRGSILDSDVRTTINFWIYMKSLLMLFDVTWLILATIWLTNYYLDAPIDLAKKFLLAIVICNWSLVFVTFITIWCTFDAAGRSWVIMKKYQRSMRETESRFNYKRSGSANRNWRQRNVIRAYQDSWDHRCRLLFCCMGSSERNRNSFTDIARLLSDFFRELDVVPSDVVAGLVLLRKFQKVEREAIVRQRKNGTYEFLSGVPITERTQFLALNDAKNYDFFQTVIHYMYFAQGAYGWPMYFIINRSKMYHLIPELKCFGCCCRHHDDLAIIQDNCCYCNYAALKKTLQIGDTEIVYVTYHVDVGETPFFVAIDYTHKKIVVSIRGTLSMKDILTDLNAEAEVLPLTPIRDDWLGHKGMVQAAIYIRNKLQEENLIAKALGHNIERNTNTFGLVLVGHSLGAGTAAILAILMKQEYPSLQCFSYSPPGGLLSMPAVEYSKSFITSVVLGKDVVPRIGLNQMETLRADLINAIQRSVDPKWKTISCSVFCCGCSSEPTSVVEMSSQDTHINQYQEERDTARSTSTHPTDSSIALTLHQPLYPPGRIIHIVRHHPKPDENVLKSHEPVYQAIWADPTDFDEVLISPVMLQDHMPDKVLAALKKVVTTSGPRKPQRQTSNAFSTISSELNHSDTEPLEKQHVHLSSLLTAVTSNSLSFPPHDDCPKKASHNSCENLNSSAVLTPTAQRRVCHETSFTNLHSPLDIQLTSAAHCDSSIGAPGSSKASSIAGGSTFGRSQMNATPFDISSIQLDDSVSTVALRRSPQSLQSETATVIVNEPLVDAVPPTSTLSAQLPPQCSQKQQQIQQQRLKAVVFDMELNYTGVAKSPSPQMPPKGILHRQYSARVSSQKPKTLPIPPLRRASDATNPVDLLHDDWFGLAPLASPETLSEISSISSRASGPISLANSIERYLHSMSTNGQVVVDVLDNIYESQLHTPKIMRRAPKFTENLSTCAEDTNNLDQYKRMGRVFVTFPRILHNQASLDSSEDDSFESALSLHKAKGNNNKSEISLAERTLPLPLPQKQSSKSADQLDDTGESSEQREVSTIKKLTYSDSDILQDDCVSLCPNCPCRYTSTTLKVGCCRRTDHTHCAVSVLMGAVGSGSDANTGSVDTTYYSANSSLEQFVTPARHISYNNTATATDGVEAKPTSDTAAQECVLRPGVLESHFPVYTTELAATTISTYNSTAPNGRREVVGGRFRKRLSSEEFIFTRSEDLPLLVQIAEKSGSASPSGRKRKNCVYPASGNTLRLPAAASPNKLNISSQQQATANPNSESSV